MKDFEHFGLFTVWKTAMVTSLLARIWQFLKSLGKINFIYLYRVRPDYPHKIFPDSRAAYCLLQETLAMGSV